MLEALTKALRNASFDTAEGAVLARSLGSQGSLALGRTPGTSGRSRFALARLWAENPWVRLAGDVVAAREAAASWFLLKPIAANGQRAVKRYRGLRPWEKDLHLGAAVDAGELSEVHDHPFLDMLAAGTQGAPAWIELPGHEVDKLERITLDLLGSFFYVIFRDPALGHPVRWWPVSPLWIQPPRPSNPHFVIGSNNFPPEEIAWYRQPRPDAPYGEGSGVAGALDHEIQINESAAEYQAALYRNRGRPDLLVMAPGLGQTEYERFEASWRAHQGPRHAGYAHFVGYSEGVPGSGKPSILVKDLSHSPADLDLEEGQKARRDAILQVWRVPQAVIGATESSNRATAREAERFIRRNRITPDLESRRNWLQQRFFEPRAPTGRPEFEGEWIVAYRLPPLDPEEDRIALMTSEPRGFRENDVFRAAGVEPIKGGEDRYFLEEAEARAAARALGEEGGSGHEEEDDRP